MTPIQPEIEERLATSEPDVEVLLAEVVGASDEEVTLASDGVMIAIPYSDIRRSNLLED